MSIQENVVINADSLTALKTLPSCSVDLILSDIPYGIAAEDWDVLHSNTNSALLGSSPAQLKAGAVFKKRGKPLNGWSEADRLISKEYYDWCFSWTGEWLRVLKPGASAIVFAGRRLALRCITAFEDAGFTYKDMLAWIKDRAPHRAQRLSVVYSRRGDKGNEERWSGWRVGNLRPTFEPVLWFTKPYPIGTTIADNVLLNGLGAFNEEALLRFQSDPENILRGGLGPGEGGLHPTQKPVRLMRSIVEMTTSENQLVLDPFCGSGSTLVAANACGRRYIGIEINPDFARIADERLSAKIGLFG
jgi:site-specific DNA-methyltransferase (adenine-specific)